MKRLFLILCLSFILIPVFSRDITLDEAISIATKNNLDIKMAGIDTSLANIDKWKAFSGFLPIYNIKYTKMNQEIPQSLQGFITMMGGSAASMGLGEEINNIDLSLTFPIITGGARFFGTKMALRAVKINKMKESSEINSVVFQTKINFYTLLFLKKKIELDKETLEFSEDEFDIMNARYQNGEIPELLLVTQGIDVQNKKNRLLQSKGEFEVAKIKFQRFLKMNENIEPVGQFSEDIPEIDRKKITDKLNSSKNLKILEEQIKLINNTKYLAFSSFLPSLIFNWNANHKAGEFSWTGSDWERTWRTVLILDFPIFDQLNGIWEHKKAKENIEKIKLGKEKLQDSLKTELESSFIDLENIKSNLNLIKSTYEQAGNNYQMTKKAYEKGEMSYQDLEKAQLLLNQTKFAYWGILLKKEITLFKIEFLTK